MEADGSTVSQKIGWLWLVASEHGPKSPTTRLVLHTLALHMSIKGDSCWPSLDTIAAESGLSRRAVQDNITAAIEAGWISKEEIPLRNGQAWRKMHYFAEIPDGKEVALIEILTRKGRAPAATRSKKGVATDAEGEASGDKKVGQHVPPNKHLKNIEKGVDKLSTGQPRTSLIGEDGRIECRKCHKRVLSHSNYQCLDCAFAIPPNATATA